MNTQHFLSIMNMKAMNLRFSSIAGHTDQLSSVLVIHLVCEKIIERWIESCLDNPTYFQKKSLTFDVKLKKAKEYALPECVYSFMKTLNKIRNKFAHRIDKTDISQEEFASLLSAIDAIPKRGGAIIIRESYIEHKGIMYGFGCNNNVSLLMMFTCIYSFILNYVIDIETAKA